MWFGASSRVWLPPRILAAPERRERRLGCEPAGLDRVVDPLQRRHVHEPRAVACDQEPRRMESLRQREEAALRERLGDLPDLFHPQRPDLWALALESEAVERDAGQVTLRPFGEHGHPRLHLVSRLEVQELLAVAPASLVPRSDATHTPVIDQQRLPRRLRQDHRARLLRLRGEPPFFFFKQKTAY